VRRGEELGDRKRNLQRTKIKIKKIKGNRNMAGGYQSTSGHCRTSMGP
jgi:hypothetical protein